MSNQTKQNDLNTHLNLKRMQYGFIRERQKTYPVTVLCRVMQASPSAFYAWTQATENTDKIKKKEALEAKARELFEENKKVYGSRRLSDALKKAGMEAGRYKVRRLMARLGLAHAGNESDR